MNYRASVAALALLAAAAVQQPASAAPVVPSAGAAHASIGVGLLTEQPDPDPDPEPGPDPEPTSTWTPQFGVQFNNPVGTLKQQKSLTTQVIKSIRKAPKGSTIRFAMYSFDIQIVANALIKAHQRGVNVQMLVNDNWTSKATLRVQAELGKNVDKDSFLRVCYQSCRGGPGNLHLKVYSFTQTGKAEHVLMTGSHNLTKRAQNLQWNDLYTFKNEEFYVVWRKYFNQLRLDKKRKNRRITYSDSSLGATFYRTVEGARAATSSSTNVTSVSGLNTSDPMLKVLKDVRCKTVKGYGINGRTKIRIMMYAWVDERGKRLAERIAQLKREGCNIAVILSVPGGGVVRVLREAGVPMRSADWNYLQTSEGSVVNFYSHLKTLMISGKYSGKNTRILWTGSENWSRMSFRNDELIMRLSGRKNFNPYMERWTSLWTSKTHIMGVRPSGKPPAGGQ